MFVVTSSAKEKLHQTIQQFSNQAGMSIRIRLNHGIPDQINLIFDWQKAGDYVVKDTKGRKIMLVAPEVFAELDGMVFDYAVSDETTGFVLLPLASTNGNLKQ